MKASIYLQTPNDSTISIKIEMTYGQMLYLHDSLKTALKTNFSGPARDFHDLLGAALDKLAKSYQCETAIDK